MAKYKKDDIIFHLSETSSIIIENILLDFRINESIITDVIIQPNSETVYNLRLRYTDYQFINIAESHLYPSIQIAIDSIGRLSVYALQKLKTQV